MRVTKNPVTLFIVAILITLTTLATLAHAMNDGTAQALAEQAEQQKRQADLDWGLIYDFYQAWVPNDPTDRRQEERCLAPVAYCIEHKADVNADCFP